jgi:hypothetical protein
MEKQPEFHFENSSRKDIISQNKDKSNPWHEVWRDGVEVWRAGVDLHRKDWKRLMNLPENFVSLEIEALKRQIQGEVGAFYGHDISRIQEISDSVDKCEKAVAQRTAQFMKEKQTDELKEIGRGNVRIIAQEAVDGNMTDFVRQTLTKDNNKESENIRDMERNGPQLEKLGKPVGMLVSAILIIAANRTNLGSKVQDIWNRLMTHTSSSSENHDPDIESGLNQRVTQIVKTPEALYPKNIALAEAEVAPEAIVVNKKPELIENLGGMKIDLTRPVKVLWSENLKTATGVNQPDWVTDPVIAKSATDMVQMAVLYGQSSMDDGREKPAWQIRPELAGLVNTTFSKRIVINCHSENGTTKPTELEPGFLGRWVEKNPDKNIDIKQPITLPCETLRVAGEKKLGGSIRMVDIYGNEVEMDIVHITKVSVAELDNVIGTNDDPNDPNARVDYDLTMLDNKSEDYGAPVWDQPGITFILCDDFDKKTGTSASRYLVSVVEKASMVDPEIPQTVIDNNPKLQEAIEWGKVVNDFQYRGDGKLVGDFMRDNIDPNPELTKILETIVNPGTDAFGGKGRGLQCFGWADARNGDILTNLAGEGKTLSNVVPDEIKGAANDWMMMTEKVVSGRTWWAGKIDYQNIRPGDRIVYWYDGPGHVKVVEAIYIDENSKFHLITSEANSQGNTAEVWISDVGSQEEFDEALGTNSAVLVKN